MRLDAVFFMPDIVDALPANVESTYLMCFSCSILWMPSLPGLQSNVLVGAAPYALPTHIPTLPQVRVQDDENPQLYDSETQVPSDMLRE